MRARLKSSAPAILLAGLILGPALALSGLISLALLVVSVVLIYFWCQPGDPLPNAYGPPPPNFDPATTPAV